MREILLLVEREVNPTWINRKGEAERKFFRRIPKLERAEYIERFCRTEERIWSINNEKVYLHQRSRKYVQTPTYSDHQWKQTEAEREMKELLGT